MHDDMLKKLGADVHGAPGERPPVFGKNPPLPRSPQQQSWGTAIAIIIIVVMVIVGAAYTWNKRTTDQYVPQPITSPGG